MGYDHSGPNRELVEQWGELDGLWLTHDHKLPYSFNSKRRGYSSDLCFASSNIEQQCTKVVYNQILKIPLCAIALTQIIMKPLRKAVKCIFREAVDSTACPGVSNDIKNLMAWYNELYEKDLFNDYTIECDSRLLARLNEVRQAKLREKLEKLDMTHSFRITFNTIKIEANS
ncbi:hypothetical protein Trydic_g13013 [Trypoxylus dichotomus]